MANGLITKGIKLEYKLASGSGTTYTEMTGLYEIPQLGSSPEKISVDNLASGMKLYINGLQDTGDCEFSFWYIPNASSSNFYSFKNTLEGQEVNFKLTFDDALSTGTGTHHGTQCSFKGVPYFFVDGKGTNDAVSFKMSVALEDLYDGSTVTAHKVFDWADRA